MKLFACAENKFAIGSPALIAWCLSRKAANISWNYASLD